MYWDVEYAVCSLDDLKNARISPVSGIVFGTQWFKGIVKHIDLVEMHWFWF